MSWGCNCKHSEKFSASKNAEFQVKRPKYQTMPSHPQKTHAMGKEGFMIPTPSKAQMLKSDNLHGGTIGALSNPYMGALHDEATLGVSTPPKNTATLTSGNGAGNPGSLKVWATVI